MSQQWLRKPERGSIILIRLIAWIALNMGRTPTRLLLHPICFYFFIFSQSTHKVVHKYLQRVLDRKTGFQDIYRLYHSFASTILDRVFFASGRYDLFNIEQYGTEVIRDRAKQHKGCILLGSHLGSFEAMRSMGVTMGKLPIRILMYEENAEKMRQVTREIFPEMDDTIIPIGSPESMLQVKEYLDEGGMVGILGDRAVSNDKTVKCNFLGHSAMFPVGPILLAATLKVPVVLCFGLYMGDNRYELHLELLSERIQVSRETRTSDLQYWVQQYANRLEYYCRKAPYNWFNFYDYWMPQDG